MQMNSSRANAPPARSLCVLRTSLVGYKMAVSALAGEETKREANDEGQKKKAQRESSRVSHRFFVFFYR